MVNLVSTNVHHFRRKRANELISYSFVDTLKDTSLQRICHPTPKSRQSLFCKMTHAMTRRNRSNLTQLIFLMSKWSRPPLPMSPWLRQTCKRFLVRARNSIMCGTMRPSLQRGRERPSAIVPRSGASSFWCTSQVLAFTSPRMTLSFPWQRQLPLKKTLVKLFMTNML